MISCIEAEGKETMVRWNARWNEEFGEEMGQMRQVRYAEMQIQLRGKWLPIIFELSDFSDFENVIAKVKAHLQEVA